ncbi:hypothetical protein V8G54_007960 [Vigna mungo]|uniref:Uncharacterized protein n=1 Tax=Vigna mungo TaxID=3915 RepID=A0AAQ3P3A5_VIGMU
MAPKRRQQHGKKKGKPSTASASTSAPAQAPATAPASAPASAPAQAPASATWPVTLLNLLPIKLKGLENYRLWKEQVRIITMSFNMERFVVKFLIPEEYANESDRKNDILSKEYQEWLIQDQILYSWLLSSLSEELFPIIARCIHSWEIWNTVNEYMVSELQSRVTELRAELSTIKKTGFLAEYLERIQVIVDSLDDAGDPVSEKEHIEAILAGLPEQYNDCATVIRGRNNPPPLTNVVSLLSIQEAQIEQFNIVVPVECLMPFKPPTAADSTDHDSERPPGPPADDNAPSSSPNCPSDAGRKSRSRRRSGRR